MEAGVRGPLSQGQVKLSEQYKEGSNKPQFIPLLKGKQGCVSTKGNSLLFLFVCLAGDGAQGFRTPEPQLLLLWLLGIPEDALKVETLLS